MVVADPRDDRRRALVEVVRGSNGSVPKGATVLQGASVAAATQAGDGKGRLVVVAPIETSEQLEAVCSQLPPSPRDRFLLALVDPEDEALTREAYAAGCNACIAHGTPQETEQRLREALSFILSRATF